MMRESDEFFHRILQHSWLEQDTCHTTVCTWRGLADEVGDEQEATTPGQRRCCGQHNSLQTTHGEGRLDECRAGSHTDGSKEDHEAELAHRVVRSTWQLPSDATGALQGTQNQAGEQWAGCRTQGERRTARKWDLDQGHEEADSQATCGSNPVQFGERLDGVTEVRLDVFCAGRRDDHLDGIAQLNVGVVGSQDHVVTTADTQYLCAVILVQRQVAQTLARNALVGDAEFLDGQVVRGARRHGAQAAAHVLDQLRQGSLGGDDHDAVTLFHLRIIVDDADLFAALNGGDAELVVEFVEKLLQVDVLGHRQADQAHDLLVRVLLVALCLPVAADGESDQQDRHEHAGGVTDGVADGRDIRAGLLSSQRQ